MLWSIGILKPAKIHRTRLLWLVKMSVCELLSVYCALENIWQQCKINVACTTAQLYKMLSNVITHTEELHNSSVVSLYF